MENITYIGITDKLGASIIVQMGFRSGSDEVADKKEYCRSGIGVT